MKYILIPVKYKAPIAALLIVYIFLFSSNITAQCWSFSIDSPQTINQSTFPNDVRGYFPDGNINVLEIGSSYYTFWAMYKNYRSISNAPLLQNHVGQLNPSTSVFGGRETDNGSSNGFNDGGMWFIGIRELDDGRLVGFFHAESHWYPRTTQGWQAYKSIGVAYSNDKGLTWGTPELILKQSTNKPDAPEWSGLGDGCVIYNHLNNKYYCYYTPVSGSVNLSMAVSSDPEAAPDSWTKWYNGSFSQPGIGGLDSPIAGLSSRPGANPSVHWNTYLNKFVMVWHGWNEKLYISASDDGEVWESPQILLDEGDKTWYPVIVGTDSTKGGQTVTLYYGNNFQSDGRRTLSYRTITFNNGKDIVETSSQLLQNGRYSIRNVSNNKNLAATGASSFDGVLVFPDTYTDQRWDITHLGNNEYRLTHACCGGVLDVENSLCTNESQVLSTTLNSASTSQIWKIDILTDGNFVIKPKNCPTQALGRQSSSSDNVVTLDYDTCNELQSWSFVVESLSNDDFKQENLVSIQSNPVKNNLTINGLSNINNVLIDIVDIKGSILDSKAYTIQNDLVNVNVNNLTAGLYFIKIKYQKSVKTLKFLKE